MFLLVLSVAKVARCALRKNHNFMLLFELTVAKVAEVARFSGVGGWDVIMLLVCRKQK